MKRDRNRLVNLARRKAGLPRIDNIFDAESKEGRDSKDVYENAFESLLAAQPWSFATKRERLKASGESPVDSYTYSYQIPSKALFLWDIYNKNDIAVSEANYFTGRSYSYYPFPLASGTKFLNSKAEVIGEHINSNYGELSVFFTIDKIFSLDDCSRQFVDILMLNMEEDFMKIDNKSEDNIQKRMRSNETTKGSKRAQAGAENRKAYGKRRSDIALAMNRFFY